VNFKDLITTVVMGIAAASVSFADTVCTSNPSSTGGTESVTIGQNEQGQPTVRLVAQGGFAKFITGVGPLVATAKREPDGTVYTFVDQFGQTGTVTVITTAFGGRLHTIASSDFGMWQDNTMYCN
jgi:hypothetical protein